MHLIIAEKHDAARRISEILAGRKPAVAKVSGVDTFRFDDRVVIGLSGHIVGLDYPESYNNWHKVDYRDLIRAEIVSKPTQERIVSALRKLGREADHVTIATDYDREGELIGVEALRILQEVNPSLKADRVRFSAITKSEILRAFAQPGEVDFNLAASGEARQIIDLVWGAALTRFISITSGRLGKEFLSVGRVQSPTLALIVDREREIESFQPKPYWEIYADLEKGIRVRHAKPRIWSRDEVDRILNSLSDVALVRSISRGGRRDRPPTPFDTTSFISAASSIGFTAANAMRIAEDLYTNGYISYPRTDNTVYPPSIDLKSLLEMLSSGPFREDALELMKGSIVPTRGKRSTTDHPPIYPTSVADKNDLKEEQWRIYELVVRRFFATLSGECVWETTSISFDIGDETFRANGSRILDPGWRRYYPYSRAEENVLPPLEEGEMLKVLGHEVLSKETQPPARFGQGRLVRLMDELGLGTKSTRHDIISKLYARAYIHGNPIRPTKTAYAVVDTLQRHAPAITKPDMTRTLENDMLKIAERKITKGEVIEESRQMLEAVFEELLAHRKEIEDSLREGLRGDRIVGRCSLCGSDLIIRRGRRGARFVGCSGYPECRFTLPLPRGGMIVVTERRCETHGMNHIRIINRGKRPWDLGCPYCNFNNWQAKKGSETQRMPELGDISGIGPKSRERLESAGIKTLDALISTDPASISESTGISIKKIISWQKSARSIISGGEQGGEVSGSSTC